MRVLIFNAATSAFAVAAMTSLSDEVRKAGHSGGLRSLPHFRREKEPADRILVALSPSQAETYKNLGAELVQTFQDADKIVPFELPEEYEDGKPNEEAYKDLDFSSLVEGFESPNEKLTMDQLRAEAIERAIELRPDSTREELEHALDLDVNAGAQAGDRVTDRRNMTDGPPVDRIGFRTSTVLPSTNGLDLERMNDDQLAATASELGLRVPKNASRTTLINKITETYAEKLGAPADSAPQAPAENFETDLTTLNEDGLKEVAEREGIDLGRATTVEGMTNKIVEARKAKADGGDNG